MYQVKVSKKVLKFLDKIPNAYLSNIRNAVNSLATNPRPFDCVKLSGFENTYRIRVGIYRIIYTIEDNILTVEIVKIDHRNKVYKSKD